MIRSIHTPCGIFENKYQLLQFCKDTGTLLKAHDARFVFNPAFDTYIFRKEYQSTWLDLAKLRFQELRNKYSHIRLWYSGGKDSRFVLDLAEKLDFKFDELVFSRNSLIDNPEVDNLWIPRYYLEQRRFIEVYLNADCFTDFFSRNNWTYQTDTFSTTAPTYHDIICNVLNRDQKWFQDMPNGVNLLGGQTPIVYFDQRWKFVFTEHDFAGYIGPSLESFLISDTLPELLNFYVCKLVHALESHNILMNWAETCNFLQRSHAHSNFFRDLVDDFKNIDTQFQFPKYAVHADPRTEPWFQQNSRIKDRMTLESMQTLFPKIADLYINNTDWDYVQRANKFGTILTSHYELI